MTARDGTEEWEIDQEQRAIFFDEKASEFKLKEINERFDELSPLEYEWDINRLNIGEDAWRTIAHSELRPVEVFCHPETIVEDEHILLNFQFLAMLSGKSLSHLGFSSNYETNHRRFKRNPDEALRYSRRINEVVSSLIESKPDGDIDSTDLVIWRSMQAGSTSGGSWRNKKGDMEEIQLKRGVFRELKDRGHIAGDIEYDSAFGVEIPLNDGVHELHFKSEPDIGVKKVGEPVYEVIVEIKGGIDPAGVLERFGAILKSFRNERSKNSDVETILTIQRAALTDESERRIEQSEEIGYTILIDGLREEDYGEAAADLVDEFVRLL